MIPTLSSTVSSISDRPTARVSAALAGEHAKGGWIFGVVAKRTYVVAGGACYPHPEQAPLVEEPELNEDGLLSHDTDLKLQRADVDVIVEGHAYAHGPERSFLASVTTDGFRRQVAVVGDRQLQVHANGQRRFSPAGSAEQIPLTWQRAYGGTDHASMKAKSLPMIDFFEQTVDAEDAREVLFTYPRNPHGVGYVITAKQRTAEPQALPNFEEPSQLLTSDNIERGDLLRWPTGPVVAGMGWLGYDFFPRGAQLGLPFCFYDGDAIKPHHFFEVAGGWLKPSAVSPDTMFQERLDVRVAQSAALGMRASEIQPGALIELCHLHPREKRWRFRLPAHPPRVAFRLPGTRAAELTTRIRTLHLEPDLNRVTVVWVGETQPGLPVMVNALEQVEHGVVWNE